MLVNPGDDVMALSEESEADLVTRIAWLYYKEKLTRRR